MFGIQFFKTTSDNYVIHYSNNKIIHEGRGLSFYYWSPTANISKVPVVSLDALFAVNEMTSDFQPVTLRGQIAFRIKDPKAIMDAYSFSVDKYGDYINDDLDKLRERMINAVGECARNLLIIKPLQETLKNVDELTDSLYEHIGNDEVLKNLGLLIEDLALISVETSPDLTRALETHARESLLKQADLATYDRRNNAVEQERKIKENELATEVAVEEKKREIRQKRISADIAIEEQKRELVDIQAANDRKLADTQAYGIQTTLEPYKGVDWRLLLALGSGNMKPNTMMAMSFQEIAQNASKIGQFNFTPDLLAAIAKDSK